MRHEREIAELALFDMEELAKPENRVKMCYAFMHSDHVYHQELSILNPNPSQFAPGHVFPTDLYRYAHHNESGKEMLPLKELQAIAAEAGTPIVCIGSHQREQDRTMQLVALPQAMATTELLLKDLILFASWFPCLLKRENGLWQSLKSSIIRCKSFIRTEKESCSSSWSTEEKTDATGNAIAKHISLILI